MKSEIKNIRQVHKFGAFGNKKSFGEWIYGKRPDGKTVACMHEKTPSGGIMIWSYWESPSCSEHEIDACYTEFTRSEWTMITKLEGNMQQIESNKILRERECRKPSAKGLSER